MVAASEESILLVDERHLHIGHMCSTSVDFLNESSQMARWRVVLVPGGDKLLNHLGWKLEAVCSATKDTDRVLIHGVKWGIAAISYNVIVEITLNVY